MLSNNNSIVSIKECWGVQHQRKRWLHSTFFVDDSHDLLEQTSLVFINKTQHPARPPSMKKSHLQLALGPFDVITQGFLFLNDLPL